MSFKLRTREQANFEGVTNPANLRGLLRQTDLNNSNEKADVALFDFLDLEVDVLEKFQFDIKNRIKVTDKIDLISQVDKVLAPANGGSFSGVYTPTLADTTNITASVATILGYQRVGNSVNVFGKVNVETTGAGDTVLGISLPILSYFLNDFECAGVASCPTIAGEVAAIFADTTNFRASMRWQTAGAATFDMFFNFGYQLIAKT